MEALHGYVVMKLYHVAPKAFRGYPAASCSSDNTIQLTPLLIPGTHFLLVLETSKKGNTLTA